MSTLTLGRYLFKCQHLSTVGRYSGSQKGVNFGQRSFWVTPNVELVKNDNENGLSIDLVEYIELSEMSKIK